MRERNIKHYIIIFFSNYGKLGCFSWREGDVGWQTKFNLRSEKSFLSAPPLYASNSRIRRRMKKVNRRPGNTFGAPSFAFSPLQHFALVCEVENPLFAQIFCSVVFSLRFYCYIMMMKNQ